VVEVTAVRMIAGGQCRTDEAQRKRLTGVRGVEEKWEMSARALSSVCNPRVENEE
jgi:hypothetical protein